MCVCVCVCVCMYVRIYMFVVIKIKGGVDGQAMLHKREKRGMRTAFWTKSYGHVPFVDFTPLRVNQ